jgi:type I restriction enzyme S subunit
MSDSVQLIHAAQAIDLTPGWSSATIEGLVGKEGVFVDGDWVESKDQDPTGDVRLIQLADIGDGEYRNRSDRFLTHKKALELGCTFLMRDDVLIARMPDPLGRACIFPGDRKKSVTVVDVAIVRSGKAEFNHRWLMYFINAPAFRTSVASLQSGSTRKRISRGNLSRISLPVPPRGQQDRIVAEIEKQFSRLDEAVATLKRVKANLKRYKAAVLKAAVEGKLTAEWRKQHPNVEPASKLLERILAERRAKWKGNGTYKEPDSLDTSNLPELPDSWCWANLEQIKLFSLYGPRFSSEDYATNGPLVLRTSDISESGKVRQDTAPRLSLTADEVSKYRLERGDLLITRTGSLGTLAVFNDAVEAIPGAYLIQYRMGAPFETVQYIFHFFKSPVGQKQLIGGGAGVGRPNLNAPTIEAISIPLPSLAEQMRIVAEVERRLSIIEELEAAVESNLTRADRLRQSILSQAFSGRLLGRDTKHIPDILPTFSIAAEGQARYGKDSRAGR